MEGPIEVSSTNVAQIAYEPANKQLMVWFLNGSGYMYSAVPEEVWEAFKNAGSKGKFVAQNLKGKFSHTRFA